ncbi:AI-2E family transporter [Foetidibacter luteolus]|uniref:AI-2E family transporter n=1 Tax=Foetidibacter luteolus TaxID=2608880 RepID=UPI00129BA4C7|nr:AI-2E family transporter [Foetidibacter luteolus]
MENRQDYKVNRYFFLSIIILFAAFLFFSLIEFFTAFLAAVIVYVLSRPFVEYLVKRKLWKKSWAAVAVIIISFFIILLPISLMVTLLYNKILPVAQNPNIIVNAVKDFEKVIHDKYGIDLFTEQTFTKIQAVVTSLLGSIVNQGLSIFTTITMMYFFLYFMLVNVNRMEAAIVFYLPFKRSKVMMFGNELVAQTFSNAIGIPLIAIAQGFSGYLSYTVAGVKEAGFWGVITGFASIIPVVGIGLVWVPVTVFLLINGQTWQGVFVALWSAIISGTADNVIRFILAKRMADVHPIVTVLGVIIGLKLFGITGLIFGPLIISYFIILLRIYYLEYQKPLMVTKKVKPRQIVPSYMQPFLGMNKGKKK